MTPEERIMLVRIDERTADWKKHHENCEVRRMVILHETKLRRAEGAIALVLILITINTGHVAWVWINQILGYR